MSHLTPSQKRSRVVWKGRMNTLQIFHSFFYGKCELRGSQYIMKQLETTRSVEKQQLKLNKNQLEQPNLTLSTQKHFQELELIKNPLRTRCYLWTEGILCLWYICPEGVLFLNSAKTKHIFRLILRDVFFFSSFGGHRLQIECVRSPRSHCWLLNTLKHRGREMKREGGRIPLIVQPALTDGRTLLKEQCDWENGPSVTLTVCVLYVCLRMYDSVTKAKYCLSLF